MREISDEVHMHSRKSLSHHWRMSPFGGQLKDKSEKETDDRFRRSFCEETSFTVYSASVQVVRANIK